MLLKIDDISFVSSLTIRYDTIACITQNKHTVAGFRLPKPRTVAVLVDDIFPRDQVLSFGVNTLQGAVFLVAVVVLLFTSNLCC